ncbi:unnamed protein product [Tetraodon nigroviridis]|uniref:(spotted green pufferfish) hypothetical protein n=1 Tax=Tetraodon nigroviridis TaxID=99883 RepID=Q4SNN3_TETNG|nr:unnamed protein product [Tetraodon nigroviridis]
MDGPRTKPKKQKAGGARGQWASKTEYILVVAGQVVGLGNVWRFPYLCYKNGGVCGIPLFLLETSLGQFTQEGFITCWRKICPLAQGIGYGQLLFKVYGFVFVIIQAWALFYLVFSFRSELPWVTCNNSWNTANCRSLQAVDSSSVNYITNQTVLPNTSTAATEFLERRVLGLSRGIEELGGVSVGSGVLLVLGSYSPSNNNCYRDCFWLCLLNSSTSFVAGFVVFSVLGFMAEEQGVAVNTVVRSGPGLAFIAYPQATALLPLPQFWSVCFFLMLILLAVDTHSSAVMYVINYKHLLVNDWYVYPDWAYALGWMMTLSPVVVPALFVVGQLCLTPGTFKQVNIQRKGAQIPWATCNNPWNTDKCRVYQDLSPASSNLTGNETTQMNATTAATEFWERRMLRMSGGIEEVGSVSWELTLCLLASWVFCYFSIWKGVRSSGKFVDVESFITTVSDMFPKWFHKPMRQEIFVLVVCASAFLVQLLLVTQGGIYIFQFFDYYASTRICGYFFAICECLALGWMFGETDSSIVAPISLLLVVNNAHIFINFPQGAILSTPPSWT